MKNILIVTMLFGLALASFANTQEATSLEAQTIGGPLRVTDYPIVHPSPFSVVRDDDMVIQYSLSEDANIDIIIFGVSGEIIKKMSFFSGQIGGLGALNQIRWDGKRDFGSLIGNGVYLGVITCPDKHQVLGKFKLTAYN